MFPVLGGPESKCEGQSPRKNNLISLKSVGNKCCLCILIPPNAVHWRLSKLWCEGPACLTWRVGRGGVWALTRVLCGLGLPPCPQLTHCAQWRVLVPSPSALSPAGRGWRECGSRCSGSLEKERTELLIVASLTSPARPPPANNSCLCRSGAKWQLVCFASSPEQRS